MKGAYITDRPLLAGVTWFKIVLSLSDAMFADGVYEDVMIK